MATTFTAKITNQNIGTATSYCYLYEPTLINVSESNSAATKIYVDLEVIDTSDGSTIVIESEYGNFDIDNGITLSIDLSELMQQYHNANVFKLGLVSEISSTKDIVVSKYKYKFKVYSDVDSTGQLVEKLPIIGGRNFYDFSAVVDSNQSLTEAELYNVDLTGRWLNYPNITTSLASPTATNSNPTITVSTEATAELEPCGGMLIWKSRFGGWMYWGMDISTRSLNSKQNGNLSVGMLETTSNGNPYVEMNYTSINSSYSINLKALALKNNELEAVSGIADSPAVYYMRSSSSKLELMKVSSSSAPISNLIGGGDFSVNLTSISYTFQKTR
jgi:hypothetical protein